MAHPALAGSLYGGTTFCNSSRTVAETGGCQWVAEFAWRDGDPRSYEWTDVLPVCIIGNGDYVAFDMKSKCVEPPLIYLDHDPHDVEENIISPCFDSFLESWEALAYIDPMIYLRGGLFIDEQGVLNPDIETRQKFKTAFKISD